MRVHHQRIARDDGRVLCQAVELPILAHRVISLRRGKWSLLGA